MKRQTMDDWNNLKGNNNFNNISTELLGYVSRKLNEQIVDNETGETRRDTGNDYLISKFFMNNITIDPERHETIYDQRASEIFISKLNEAVEEAKEKGDSTRIESLSTILEVANELKIGIEREKASEVIHNFRYMNLNGEKILVGDETLLSNINRFFDELGEQASAGYALNNSIYVYLTNAKDKDDLLKRMEAVSSKLEEYEKVKSSESMDYTKGAIGNAIKDFESGDILGIDKDVEER